MSYVRPSRLHLVEHLRMRRERYAIEKEPSS
jgi:hypothetical protein